MPLTYVTITGTFEDGTGAPLSGTATFTPSATVYSATGVIVTEDTTITAKITAGALTAEAGGALTLLATDNSGLAVEGLTGFWYWTVTVNVTGSQTWSFFLPSSPDTVDLYALANTTTPGGGAGSGTVTSVSVASADGFAGTVANPSTTPAITLETTVTGLLKGNGTAISAAAAGTDYLAPAGNGSALTGLTESQVSGLTSDLAAKLARGGGTMTGWLAPAVVTLAQSGGTVAVNAALGNDFRLTLTASGWTISNPLSPVDGQVIEFAIAQDATGSRTVSWDTAYDFGTTGAPTLTTTASKVDLIGWKYHAGLSKWLCQGSALGF